jgi:protochlorophyllide reductase
VTKWTADDIPDQSGRTVLVTGANSGLGLHTARALAAKGARVLMACRSPERGEAAALEISEDVAAAGSSGTAEVVTLDLASLDSVRAAATAVRETTGDALDALVNNAGVMAPPRSGTADGFELQIGTNHLGHAALTWLLMPALRAKPGARVVTVSSMLHNRGGLEASDLNFERRRYDPWTGYSQSKVANLLFAFELDRRASAAGLDLVSVGAHPGLSDTELTANMMRARGSSNLLATISDRAIGLFAQSAEHGAWPQLYAATMPDVRGGQFWGPDGLRLMRGHPKQVRASRMASDPQLAARVWQLTAELTKVDPDPA